MIKLLYNKVNDTVELHYSGHPKFTSYIRNDLHISKRTWVPTEMCWVIVSEALTELLPIIHDEFDTVDSRNLPEDIGSRKVSKTSLGVLHLTEDAPEFLIKAVYKRLAKQYHPDGDEPNEEHFKKVSEAYKSIKKK